MSSLERSNPPPRRKSCGACRAAKRRCDLALPACFRCARRNIACLYPLPAPDQISDLLALLDEQDGLVVGSETLQSDQILEPDTLETHPVQDGLVHVRRLHLEMDELIASRFQYSIDTLKNTPRTMVTENQTPWSHPQLYNNGMPKAMQDAYACCALFIAKNPINAPMVTTHIHSRHQELLLCPLPTLPEDLLGYTQALLLYQIMHLFDPDLHALNTATSLDTLSISALESAASLLFTTTHFPHQTETDQSPALVLSPATPAFWTLWLAEESARRTILFAFYLIQIIRLFRGDKNMQCDGKLGLSHSWYLSAYLWKAASGMEFAAAWTEREHFVVRNVDFDMVLRDAQPGDVDCFARMMLVTLLGVGTVTEWFGGRGGVL